MQSGLFFKPHDIPDMYKRRNGERGTECTDSSRRRTKEDQVDVATGMDGQSAAKRTSQKGNGVNQDGDSEEDIPLAKFKQKKVNCCDVHM